MLVWYEAPESTVKDYEEFKYEYNINHFYLHVQPQRFMCWLNRNTIQRKYPSAILKPGFSSSDV